jgi:hypothetical protein
VQHGVDGGELRIEMGGGEFVVVITPTSKADAINVLREAKRQDSIVSRRTRTPERAGRKVSPAWVWRHPIRLARDVGMTSAQIARETGRTMAEVDEFASATPAPTGLSGSESPAMAGDLALYWRSPASSVVSGFTVGTAGFEPATARPPAGCGLR